MLICALLRIDLAFCFQIWHGLRNSATGRLPWKSFVCFYPAALDALRFWYPLALSSLQHYCPSTPWSTITAICPSNQSIKNCPVFLGKQNKAKQNRWLAKCRLVFLHCRVSSWRIADSVTASRFSILIAVIFFSLFLPAKLLAFDQKSHTCLEDMDCCQLEPVCCAAEGRVRCNSWGGKRVYWHADVQYIYKYVVNRSFKPLIVHIKHWVLYQVYIKSFWLASAPHGSPRFQWLLW